MRVSFLLKTLAATCLLLAGAQASKASTTYDFNQNACNSGLGCSGSGLVATATVTNDADGVLVVFHIVNSSFTFFEAGNPPWVGLNIPVSGVTLDLPPTGTTSGGPPSVAWSLTGAVGPLGSAGSFTNGAGFPQHNVQFSGDVTLDLDGATLTESSFTANANGFPIAIDMCNLTGGTSGGCGGTGFIGGVLTATPAPAALPLFAAGLGLVGLFARNKRRKAQPVA